jgi:hypothetical protein
VIDHSNTKTGRDGGMPESTAQNITNHARGIKDKSKFASAFCGLQTSTSNRSVTVMEIRSLLTVWIEDFRQTHRLSCSPWIKGPSQHLRPTT